MSHTNYFALFNIPEHYDIQLTNLKQRYEILKMQIRNNKQASQNENEQLSNARKANEVNEAYTVMLSPVLRGEHLLKIRGYQLASEQDAFIDSDFLSEQMELRESLTEAQTLVDFEAFERKVKGIMDDYSDRISISLNADNNVSNKAASIEISKLKFLVKLLSDIEVRKEFVLTL